MEDEYIPQKMRQNHKLVYLAKKKNRNKLN